MVRVKGAFKISGSVGDNRFYAESEFEKHRIVQDKLYIGSAEILRHSFPDYITVLPSSRNMLAAP